MDGYKVTSFVDMPARLAALLPLARRRGLELKWKRKNGRNVFAVGNDERGILLVSPNIQTIKMFLKDFK